MTRGNATRVIEAKLGNSTTSMYVASPVHRPRKSPGAPLPPVAAGLLLVVVAKPGVALVLISSKILIHFCSKYRLMDLLDAATC